MSGLPIPKPRQLSIPLGLLGIFSLYFGLTIPLAAILNLWFDEAYSLASSSQSLAHTIHQAIIFEEQAPLYFVLLFLLRQIHDSIFFARLFSIVCVGLAIALTLQVSKRLFPSVNPLWLGSVLVLHPHLIAIAIDIRMYALSVFWGALLYRLFCDRYWWKDGWTHPWLYRGIAIVACYTHYLLGFVILSQGIVVLALRPKGALKQYLHDALWIGLGCIPVGALVIYQVGLQTDNPVIYSPLNGASALRLALGKSILRLGVYAFSGPAGEALGGGWQLLRFAGIGLLGGLVYRHRRRLSSEVKLALGLVISLALILFGVCLKLPVIDYRHCIVLLLPTLMGAIACLSLAQPKHQRYWLTLWLILVLGLNGPALGKTYAPLAKPGDYQRVATYLEQHESRNQPILVFNAEVAMTLGHYYRGQQALVPLPTALNFDDYCLDELRLTHPDTLQKIVTQLGNPERLWLIQDTKILTKTPIFAESYRWLNEFIAQSYDIEQSIDFFGTKLQQLKRQIHP